MQFANYWQQFEHTGRVEDYLSYLQSAEREGESHGVKGGCTGESMAEGITESFAGEDESCRNPCM